MLTGKQKRFLRSLANKLDPIFQVGKSGVNPNMLTQVGEALAVRELIKISILPNCEDDRHQVATKLSEGTDSEVVQVIGKTIILYKEADENKQIKLP